MDILVQSVYLECNIFCLNTLEDAFYIGIVFPLGQVTAYNSTPVLN